MIAALAVICLHQAICASGTELAEIGDIEHAGDVAPEDVAASRLVEVAHQRLVLGKLHVHQAEGHITAEADALRPKVRDHVENRDLVNRAADDGDIGVFGGRLDRRPVEEL